MVRGKSIIVAKNILDNVSKKARHPISALIDSAVANASHNHKIEKDNLFVKEIRVDQGYVLKRSMPMARGSAFPMKKRTSHISIILASAPVKKAKVATDKKLADSPNRAGHKK